MAGITKFGDALWFVFVACTSIGFGDFVTVTFVGRLLTVLSTLYEIVIIAMFSGVVVSYYLELVRRKENEILSGYLDKLEHLTELPPEELKQIEDKVREMTEGRILASAVRRNSRLRVFVISSY